VVRGGRRRRSNGKGEVLEEPDWDILSFSKKPVKLQCILSNIMPIRKEVELVEHYIKQEFKKGVSVN
jgi:hypothetical protein